MSVNGNQPESNDIIKHILEHFQLWALLLSRAKSINKGLSQKSQFFTQANFELPKTVILDHF